MLWKPNQWQGLMVAVMLTACRLWIAWAYLLTRYATINWAAPYVAAAFVGEALLLVAVGTLGRSSLSTDTRMAGRIGAGLYVFALVVQPLIGPLAGRAWSQVEILGIAPDPTVVATLGLVLRAPVGVCRPHAQVHRAAARPCPPRRGACAPSAASPRPSRAGRRSPWS